MERFGVRLFRRVKRRLVLTEEGERLFEATNQAFGLLNDARNRLERKQISHKLILRVSPSFGVRWLSPRLTSYVRLHAEQDIHIDATADLTNFEIEQVDLDIRYGKGNWPGVYSEAVVYDSILPLCSAEYAARLRDFGQSPSVQLANARMISTVKADWSWDRWTSIHNLPPQDSQGRLLFDRSSMSLQMACDHVGVVLESATLAMPELQSGALVPLFPSMGAIRFAAYWLVCPERHLYRQQVREFRQWLQAAAGQHEEEKNRLLDDLECIRRPLSP